ncbi:Paf1-domain-containing protein [Aureobasidium subglaciale]|nr:Paf1-domain-containing protein [Aureobasidium subglaciale]
MASGRSERVYHQDYIARIRYSNTLPPPPNPPKLLDIPGTGLASNNYTSASYALKLAREQPLNIEADAELGMPIDLVGLPGVFDGDESAIMAQDPLPSLHPKDRALLKPLSALGKPTAMNSGVSFLRRTEYISSNAAAVQRFESSTSKDLLRVRNDPKRRKTQALNRDDPINIIRSLVKGFDLAYPEDAYTGQDSSTNIRGAPITEADRSAWNKPKHPTNPNLTLLDAYPLLPDMDALPLTGDYQIVKFSTNPVATSDSYDQRLDTAVLRPLGADLALHEDRIAAHKADPTMPKPLAEWDYDLFLAENESSVRGIKRKFDPNDAQNDDQSLYDNEADGEGCFMFQRVREYETYQQAGDADNAYGDTVALALHDDDGVRLAKGAYFYPVKQRTNLRPKRKTANFVDENRAEPVDVLQLKVRDPSSDEASQRLEQKALLEPPTESA